jgi:heavy metal sensor kinase
MNYRSVRFRLTALYSSALIVSLLIMFAAFFWITQRELYIHTDSELRSHASRIISILTANQYRSEVQVSSQLLGDVLSETPGMLVSVTDSTGNIILFPDSAPGSEIVSSMVRELRPQGDAVFTNRTVGHSDMRFILMPVLAPCCTGQVIVMAHPLDVIRDSLRSLSVSLFLVFLAVVIPTVFGGYMLAGSAMQPVSRMAGELRQISSENLKARIEEPRTDDELADLTRTFNQLLDRLESAFGHERQFIGDVAHELKTPLATIISQIEVIKSKKRNVSEYRQALGELLIDANRLSATLTDVLDLAWSRSDGSGTGVTDLPQLIREVSEIAQKLGARKKITVTTNVLPEAQAGGERKKLFRALLNIVENAVKYTPAGGSISISLSDSDSMYTVRIRDTGQGIRSEDVPRIFDRFFRGESSGKTRGSGLGLAIAKNLIEHSGGSVTAQSIPGQGTVMTIHFLKNQTRADFS